MVETSAEVEAAVLEARAQGGKAADIRWTLMPLDFELPRGAEREYLIVFGVAAIYIGTIPAGEPCVVGATRDLEKSSAGLQERWPGAGITAAFWVTDRDIAEAIAGEVNGMLPRDSTKGRIAVRGERARSEIEDVAEQWNIPLTNHDAAMARVKWAVRRVSDELQYANGSGGLGWFNAAYREWRFNAKKVGQGMSYTEALARLRKVVTKRLVLHDVIVYDSNMLCEIFPPLIAKSAKKSAKRRLTG